MKHKGDLTITNENYEKYKDLTTVSGYLEIRSENTSLPALQSCGNLYIRAENASLPALTTVSGNLEIRSENTSLPALQSCGNLEIQAENTSLPDDFKCASYKKTAPLPLACPKDGEFEAWKKCEYGIIVKLLVPADARRSSAEGDKCRAEFVDVIEILGAKTAISKHDGETLYQVGKRIKCHKWDSCRWNECSGGIHFFMTREEAEAY